jgi:signal-transduction protein with cAMP-binding, CBS, and nucleotidyltransferase domain
VIDPHELSTLQRAQLAESLGIVHRFKEVVRHHFKLSFLLGA